MAGFNAPLSFLGISAFMSGWDITGGVANYIGSGDDDLSQDCLPAIGSTVLIEFYIPRWVSGDLRVFAGAGAYEDVSLSSGLESNLFLEVTGDTVLMFRAIGEGDFDLDDVSVIDIETGAVLYNTASEDWDRSKS